MSNLDWLATEATKLHGIFEHLFFAMISCFLVIAVVLEYFRFPLGETPGFMTLVGRAVLASILLVALPEFMNTVASLTDSIAREVGGLNDIKFVLSRLGEKLKDLTWSWVSVKDMVILAISFLSFFLLYITVYFADAAYLYAWTLIYVFSPLVLALYIFPVTAGATKALFRAILEVSFWKICWSIMATLLWSTALSEINRPNSHVDFLTAIVLNIMLALSVLLTPMLVRGIFSQGITTVASGIQGMAMAGAALTPIGAITKTKAVAMLPINKISKNVGQKFYSQNEKPKPTRPLASKKHGKFSKHKKGTQKSKK